MMSKLGLVVLLALVCVTVEAKVKRSKDAKMAAKRQSKLHVRQVDSPDTVCDSNEFKCSDYSCVPLAYQCDTESDCFNSQDETNCPTDCSGEHQFQCDSDKTCISHRRHCDGNPDCLDWSDEWNCKEFSCLEGYTHCVTSQECIQESYRCDGDPDCRDGSDEQGCPTTACFSHQFQCANGTRHCVPQTYVCDGDKDCTDGSDEVGCTCSGNQFACSNGGCIDGSWKCDGDNDCGDMSDEVNCQEAPDSTCFDVLTGPDCMQMNETAHPICEIYADAHKFCRKYCSLCGLPAGSTYPPSTLAPGTFAPGSTLAPGASTAPPVIEIGK